MTARTRTAIFSLLFFFFLTCLTVPAMASGTMIDGFENNYAAMLTPDMPSPFTMPLTQMQQELFALAGISMVKAKARITAFFIQTSIVVL